MKAPILVVAFALVAVALAAQATHTFIPVRKVGEVRRVKTIAKFEVQGIQIEQSFVGREEITKVEEDGTFTAKSSISDMKLLVNGNEQAAPPMDSNEVRTSTRAGVLIETTEASQPVEFQRRISVLTSIQVPASAVSVGDTWTVTLPADAKKGLVKAEATYKLVAEEKVGAWDGLKVEVNVRELEGAEPMSLKGTYWVQKGTYDVLKLESKIENFTSPGLPGPFAIDIKVEKLP